MKSLLLLTGAAVVAAVCFGPAVAEGRQHQPRASQLIEILIELSERGEPRETEQQQPAEDRKPGRRATDLAGRWLMTLPAGFEHHVRLKPKGDNRFRLDIKGKPVVLEGIYKRCGDRLVIVKPDDERMTSFEWKIINANVLLLVDQRHPSPNGGNYNDATLSRLKGRKPRSSRRQ